MSESLERVEYLFTEALGRSPSERQEYLLQACREDQSLIAEVEALLRAHDNGDLKSSRGGNSAAPAGDAGADTLLDKFLGSRVGPYKLLQKIGEGGCGAVYLAEQAEPIRRRVALKIIKLGMDTREVIARFEAERQTLALMDHPNIARVFECGATEAGRPYFVMELVQGISITRFCEDRRLPLLKRLELFIPVCRAIQHAHERGIVHRDIKPSNILVAISDGLPTPKVIDFGVAKATESRPSDKTLFTSYEQFIGTPLYMSPEQAELGSAGVDARSDIYSLGVLLYELLTGCTPFESINQARASFEEMRRRVKEDEALPPSKRLSLLDGHTLATLSKSRGIEPQKLAGFLRGDLDWIVMRCIEKDPSGRYSTAIGLAEEIGRYLRHEPVLAAAPGLGVKLRRLSRRHRAGLQAAGAAAAVVLAGAAGLLWSRSQRVAEVETTSATPAVVSQRSIAVLPFTNLSPDPANAFFASGVHEDLINNLSKIHDLKVISRTSVMAYRGGSNSLRAIAEDFGVANVLEGTVRRSGDEVRVTVQLFNALTEQPIWADSYDRKLTDIFSIQSDLSRSIAGALEASLTADERRLIDRRPTTSQAAYDLYLRARAVDDQLGSNATLGEYEPILTLYNQAVSKDPKFVLAYIQIAMLDLKLYWYSRLDTSEARLALAQAAAEAAVRLAPDDPETKLMLGHIDYHVALNWSRALLEFEAAASEMPNDDQAIFAVGFTLRRLGRWNESIEYLERASSHNPRSLSESVALIETLFFLRRYAQARVDGQQYLVRFPDNRELAEWLLRAQYELDGDRDAFLHGIDALPRDPDDPLGILDRYTAAAERADWSVAGRALADQRLTPIADYAGILTDPPALYRAMVACIRQDQAAALFADQAIDYYRNGTWVPRQRPWVSLKIAEAEAYAGRFDQAVRDAQAGWAGVFGRDAYDAALMHVQLGRIYAIAGRREDALQLLGKAAGEPCGWGPQKIRHDPFWSRLSDDPRFETILQSTTAL